MKGEMKEGVGAFSMFPTTPSPPSFVKSGNPGIIIFSKQNEISK
jgi:hypothetical protein